MWGNIPPLSLSSPLPTVARSLREEEKEARLEGGQIGGETETDRIHEYAENRLNFAI